MRRSVLLIVALALPATAGADDPPGPIPVKEPELRLELLQRVKEDQAARGAIVLWIIEAGVKTDIADEAAFVASLDKKQKAEFQELSERIEPIDRKNTERLGEIVERHG